MGNVTMPTFMVAPTHADSPIINWLIERRGGVD
jgi:hypothetical protein